MGSKTKAQRALEEDVKRKIVDGYRRGVCDAEGRTLPRRKWGAAGRGSRFRPPMSAAERAEYRRNYRAIFGHE